MRYVSIVLLLAASTAYAAKWIPIGALDAKGGVLLLDTAGIARVNDVRKAWFKYDYTTDQTIPLGYTRTSPDAKSYRKDISLMYFNCTDRKWGLSKSILHAANEAVVGDLDDSQSVITYREVPPDSVGELMLNAVCGWELPRETVDAKSATPQAADPARVRAYAKMVRPVSPADYYPPASIRRGEQGSPIVQACVGPDGRLLREPVVTDTSGFPDLDAAAIKVAKATRYAAAMENGTALPESCIKFKVMFARHNQ